MVLPDQRNQAPDLAHTNIDFIQMSLAQERPPIGKRLSNRKFRKQSQTADAPHRAFVDVFLACISLVNLTLTDPLPFSCVCRSTDSFLSRALTIKAIVFYFQCNFKSLLLLFVTVHHCSSKTMGIHGFIIHVIIQNTWIEWIKALK